MNSDSGQIKKELEHLYSIQPKETETKVNAVRSIFKKTKADEATQMAIADYTEKAFDILHKLDISQDKKDILKQFGENLMNRKV